MKKAATTQTRNDLPGASTFSKLSVNKYLSLFVAMLLNNL